MKVLKVYTDGGYRRKYKIGAYAFLISLDDTIIVSSSYATVETENNKVTNNIMELQGVIKALNWLISNGYATDEYVVYMWTDSQYVQLGLTEWIHNWKVNGWKNASKKPVKNKELWVKLDKLFNELGKSYKAITLQWIEGHSGNEWNDKVDLMCNESMDNYILNN